MPAAHPARRSLAVTITSPTVAADPGRDSSASITGLVRRDAAVPAEPTLAKPWHAMCGRVHRGPSWTDAVAQEDHVGFRVGSLPHGGYITEW